MSNGGLAHEHDEEICGEGLVAYEKAVANGTIEADRVPACLFRLGLLKPLTDGPPLMIPVAAPIALANAIRPIETEIEQRRAHVASLHVVYADLEAAYIRARDQQPTQIFTVEGSASIDAILDSEVQRCTSELITAQPGGQRPQGWLSLALERDVACLGRGVHQRTIYQHAVRSHPPTLAYIQQVTAAGAEVRTMGEVFDRLIICDRRTAFIPVADDRQNAAMVIHEPTVIRFLIKAFNHIWNSAVPLEDGAAMAKSAAITNDLHLRTVRLLVEGYTDASIASRLGVSARTVGQYVRTISEQLGSHSRAQLGFLIATSGLLDLAQPA